MFGLNKKDTNGDKLNLKDTTKKITTNQSAVPDLICKVSNFHIKM